MFTRMEALSAMSTFNRIERPEESMAYLFKTKCARSYRPTRSYIVSLSPLINVFLSEV